MPEPSTSDHPKPSTQELFGKIYGHHKDMIDGVAGEISSVDPHMAHVADGIKAYCMKAHEALSELHEAHGKLYDGLKLPNYPEDLKPSEERKKGSAEESREEQLRDVERQESDEEMTEEDVKEFEAKFKELQEIAEKNDEEIAALRAK
jgi:hypothetical protein